jgi:hypothetical protein
MSDLYPVGTVLKHVDPEVNPDTYTIVNLRTSYSFYTYDVVNDITGYSGGIPHDTANWVPVSRIDETYVVRWTGDDIPVDNNDKATGIIIRNAIRHTDPNAKLIRITEEEVN